MRSSAKPTMGAVSASNSRLQGGNGNEISGYGSEQMGRTDGPEFVTQPYDSTLCRTLTCRQIQRQGVLPSVCESVRKGGSEPQDLAGVVLLQDCAESLFLFDEQVAHGQRAVSQMEVARAPLVRVSGLAIQSQGSGSVRRPGVSKASVCRPGLSKPLP